MDYLIKAKFDQQVETLLTSLVTPSNEVDKQIVDMIKGYFELGFEEGCRASAIYSKELKELYEDVNLD